MGHENCVFDMDEFLSFCETTDDEYVNRSDDFFGSCLPHTKFDDYARYGVDNDFDLIEVMYDKYHESMNNAIRVPWFVDFRIQCAMNPEYTEKCLQSRAFRDVRDDILKKFGNT